MIEVDNISFSSATRPIRKSNSAKISKVQKAVIYLISQGESLYYSIQVDTTVRQKTSEEIKELIFQSSSKSLAKFLSKHDEPIF